MKKLHYELSISTNEVRLLLLECSDLTPELVEVNSMLENITNNIPTSWYSLPNSTFPCYQIYFPSTSEDDEDSLDEQT